MENILHFHESQTKRGCLLGDDKRRNHLVMESHAFGLILVLAVASILLFHDKLMRFYRPLAITVNITIILKILDCLSYFAFYPYDEDEGNCLELVLSRSFNFLLMFGELHQIYVS